MAGSDVSVADLSVSVMVRHESDSVAFHLSSSELDHCITLVSTATHGYDI